MEFHQFKKINLSQLDFFVKTLCSEMFADKINMAVALYGIYLSAK